MSLGDMALSVLHQDMSHSKCAVSDITEGTTVNCTVMPIVMQKSQEYCIILLVTH